MVSTAGDLDVPGGTAKSWHKSQEGKAKSWRGFLCFIVQSKLQTEIMPFIQTLASRQTIWFYVFIYIGCITPTHSNYH